MVETLIMRIKILLFALIGTGLLLISPSHASDSGTKLDLRAASNLMKLPLSCVGTEYPNKLSQTLRGDADLASPRQLHPAFYGCFDWHSSVHGHWSMVRLLKAFPNIDGHERAKSLLQKHIPSVNISADIDYLKIHPSWERPYGWAWLLKLMQEIHTWDDPAAEGLGQALKPLAEELSAMYISHLPKLVYPIRVGEHTNTAFGLTFASDYPIHVEHADLVYAIRHQAWTLLQ